MLKIIKISRVYLFLMVAASLSLFSVPTFAKVRELPMLGSHPSLGKDFSLPSSLGGLLVDPYEGERRDTPFGYVTDEEADEEADELYRSWERQNLSLHRESYLIRKPEESVYKYIARVIKTEFESLAAFPHDKQPRSSTRDSLKKLFIMQASKGGDGSGNESGDEGKGDDNKKQQQNNNGGDDQPNDDQYQEEKNGFGSGAGGSGDDRDDGKENKNNNEPQATDEDPEVLLKRMRGKELITKRDFDILLMIREKKPDLFVKCIPALREADTRGERFCYDVERYRILKNKTSIPEESRMLYDDGIESLSQEGAIEEALKLFKEALALIDIKSLTEGRDLRFLSSLYYDVAVAHASLGEHKEAVKYFDEIYGNDALLWSMAQSGWGMKLLYQLGLSLAQLGRRQEVLDCTDSMITIERWIIGEVRGYSPDIEQLYECRRDLLSKLPPLKISDNDSDEEEEGGYNETDGEKDILNLNSIRTFMIEHFPDVELDSEEYPILEKKLEEFLRLFNIDQSSLDNEESIGGFPVHEVVVFLLAPDFLHCNMGRISDFEERLVRVDAVAKKRLDTMISDFEKRVGSLDAVEKEELEREIKREKEREKVRKIKREREIEREIKFLLFTGMTDSGAIASYAQKISLILLSMAGMEDDPYKQIEHRKRSVIFLMIAHGVYCCRGVDDQMYSSERERLIISLVETYYGKEGGWGAYRDGWFNDEGHKKIVFNGFTHDLKHYESKVCANEIFALLITCALLDLFKLDDVKKVTDILTKKLDDEKLRRRLTKLNEEKKCLQVWIDFEKSGVREDKSHLAAVSRQHELDGCQDKITRLEDIQRKNRAFLEKIKRLFYFSTLPELRELLSFLYDPKTYANQRRSKAGIIDDDFKKPILSLREFIQDVLQGFPDLNKKLGVKKARKWVDGAKMMSGFFFGGKLKLSSWCASKKDNSCVDKKDEEHKFDFGNLSFFAPKEGSKKDEDEYEYEDEDMNDDDDLKDIFRF